MYFGWLSLTNSCMDTLTTEHVFGPAKLKNIRRANARKKVMLPAC